MNAAQFLNIRVLCAIIPVIVLIAGADSCDPKKPVSASKPTVTSITSTSATLGGSASAGDETITERGIVYARTGENGNPEIGGAGVTKLTASGTADGAFTVPVTGLTAGNTYTFRAFVNTATYSEPVTFETVGPAVDGPVVGNPSYGSVTSTTATLSGNVVNGGSTAITARGIVFAQLADNADPKLGGAKVTRVDTSGTTGYFSLPVTGLQADTLYAFKAFASNSSAVGYSKVEYFRTPLASPPGLVGTVGLPDATFLANVDIPGSTPSVAAIAVQPDGKTLIGGQFSVVNGVARQCLARLNADGTLDTSFTANIGSFGSVSSLAVLADGKILVGGFFYEINGAPHDSIARLNPDGSVDTSFTAGASDGNVSAMVVQADGKILVGGTFLALNGNSDYWWFGRFNADGTLDTGFIPGATGNEFPNDPVNSIAVQEDGKILLAGWFSRYAGADNEGLVRLNANGTLDSSFTPQAPGGNVVAVQRDGKILTIGFGSASLVRLNADGSRDLSFAPPLGGTGYSVVTSLALQADDKILVGGAFTSVGGVPVQGIARLNPDGTLDVRFNPGSGANGTVSAVALQADGGVLLGGSFTTLNGAAHPSIGRLTNDVAYPTLVAEGAGVVSWARERSASLLSSASFDLSTDAGATWTPLGAGVRTPGGWNLSGLSLPASGKLRASGATISGSGNGSTGRVQQVADFPAPSVSNPVATIIGHTGAGLGATVSEGAGATEAGILFAESAVNANPRLGGPGVSRSLALAASGSFGVWASPLTPNRAYSFVGYVVSTSGTFYTTTATFTTTGLPSLADTTAVLSLGPTLADFNSSVTDQGASPILERGFVLVRKSLIPAPTISNALKIDAAGTNGPFNAQFGFLFSNEEYVVRAFATNAYGTAYSNLVSFTVPGLPKLASPTVTNITDTTATLQCEVTSDGGSPITERGFGYIPIGQASSDRLVTKSGQSKVPVSGTTGVFSLDLTGLVPGSGYTIAGYATNALGTNLSSDLVFTTTGIAPSAAPAARGFAGSDSAALGSGALLGAASVGAVDLSYDPSIDTGGTFVQALATQADGKTIVAGSFHTVGGGEHITLARVNADGSEDASFTAATNGVVYSVAVQPDGKILLAGAFSKVNGVVRNGIARLKPDGSLDDDADFSPLAAADNAIYSLAVQPDGHIVIGGLFENVNGAPRNRIARLNPDGTLESSTTFNPGTGADDAVFCTSLQSDGKILIGGNFLTVNGTTRNRIARLNADGSVDPTFSPGSGANDKVSCILVQPDGQILVAGYFLDFQGSSVADRLVRLNPNGLMESAATFDTSNGADNRVYSMTLQQDKKILIGGQFQNIGSTARSRIARLNANGSVDSTFNPGTGTDGDVVAIALQADGGILIGGQFTTVDGHARSNLARYENDAVTRTLAVVDATRLTWTYHGAGPELSGVEFQLSTDVGSTWSPLGSGTRQTDAWTITGLALPPVGTVRAVGRTTGGFLSASSGVIAESATLALVAGDIAVEVAGGPAVADGGSVDMGSPTAGFGVDKRFFLRNTGSGLLAGLQLRLDGPDAAEFSIVYTPLTPVNAGNLTDFKLRFTPASAGPKTATLHIDSNDPDEGQYAITLTGNGYAGAHLQLGDTLNLDLSWVPVGFGEVMKVLGLPPGLTFNPGTPPTITGTALGVAPVGGTTIQVFRGKTLLYNIPLEIVVDAYSPAGSYEVLLESAGAPTGKLGLTITNAAPTPAYTAMLDRSGELRRTTKGSVVAGASPLTVHVVFPVYKTYPAVSYDVVITTGSDLITATTVPASSTTARGFRLARPVRTPGGSPALTMTLPPATPGDRETTPGGIGFAKGTVSSKALASLSGQLGDAQAFTAGLNLSQTNQAIVWLTPYTNKASYVGGIVNIGELGTANRAASYSILLTSMQWKREADAKATSYPAGFGPLTLGATPSRWIKMAKADALADALGIGATREMEVNVIASTFDQMPTFLSLRDNFTLLRFSPDNAVPFTTTIAPSTGTFTGNLTLPAPAAKSAITGVMLQDNAFGTLIGQGIVKIPIAGGVKGSFQTAGIEFTKASSTLGQQRTIGSVFSDDLSRYLLAPGETLTVIGLPAGLVFTAGPPPMITGTLKGLVGTAGITVQVFNGRTLLRSYAYTLDTTPYRFANSYEVLLEDAGLPVGKLRFNGTGPTAKSTAAAFTATLNRPGEPQRSTKGTFTDSGVNNQTVRIAFSAFKTFPAVSYDLVFNNEAELLSSCETVPVSSVTGRGFRLASAARIPVGNPLLTLTFPPATPGNRTTTPGGIGWAKGSIASTGLVPLSGVLGDGKAFTISLSLSATQQAIVWLTPYKTTTSYLSGIIDLGYLGAADRGTAALSATNGLKWQRQPDATEVSYPAGFGPLNLTTKTSRWFKQSNAEALANSLGLNFRTIKVSYLAPTADTLPTRISLRDNYSLLRLDPTDAVPFTGNTLGTSGTFSGTLNLPAPATKSLMSGVLIQDATFGALIGQGLIQVPITAPVKGSFQTIGVELEN